MGQLLGHPSENTQTVLAEVKEVQARAHKQLTLRRDLLARLDEEIKRRDADESYALKLADAIDRIDDKLPRLQDELQHEQQQLEQLQQKDREATAALQALAISLGVVAALLVAQHTKKAKRGL